jgi:hypothetical protein
MATSNQTDSGFFLETRRGSAAINPYNSNPDEWWLNVNYAEVIEMRDAVSNKTFSARARN